MKAIKKILARHDGGMSVVPTFGRLGRRIMSSRPVSGSYVHRYQISYY